jgi:flagella basal body P-ring formation protein FlgA
VSFAKAGAVAMIVLVEAMLMQAAKGEPTTQSLSAVRVAEFPQRSRHWVQPEQLRRVVQRYLEQELNGKVREVEVRVIEPQEPIPAPSARVDLTVVPGLSEEGLGRRLFRVQLSHRGRTVDTVEVLSDIAGYDQVVVPSRLIMMDEIIESGDLTVSRVRLFDLKQQFVTDPNDVIGKSASRPLQPQSPIRLTSVKKPYAVRKGDRVTIEATGAGLSIQAVGITKSGGELGQTVTVSNADSGKELRAKVIGPGIVRVDF